MFSRICKPHRICGERKAALNIRTGEWPIVHFTKPNLTAEKLQAPPKANISPLLVPTAVPPTFGGPAIGLGEKAATIVVGSRVTLAHGARSRSIPSQHHGSSAAPPLPLSSLPSIRAAAETSPRHSPRARAARHGLRASAAASACPGPRTRKAARPGPAARTWGLRGRRHTANGPGRPAGPGRRLGRAAGPVRAHSHPTPRRRARGAARRRRRARMGAAERRRGGRWCC
jgi:hypothetical protein